jgi:predicted membrane channel-forming protein YqfA (hemolysin III family)
VTPEQVTKRKSWSYALFGAGIAALVMAYQYATPAPRTEPPPEWAPFLFSAIGIVCLIVAGIITVKLSKETTPAATTYLKSPQGRVVIHLMVAGGIALVALTVVNFMVPEGDPLWLAASVVLLGIMGVCFVSAGRIAKKIRTSAATTGAAKE